MSNLCLKQAHSYSLKQICRKNLTVYMIQVWLIVFNATFTNISVILWRSVLLVEETGVPGENQPSVTSH